MRVMGGEIWEVQFSERDFRSPARPDDNHTKARKIVIDWFIRVVFSTVADQRLHLCVVIQLIAVRSSLGALASPGDLTGGRGDEQVFQ